MEISDILNDLRDKIKRKELYVKGGNEHELVTNISIDSNSVLIQSIRSMGFFKYKNDTSDKFVTDVSVCNDIRYSINDFKYLINYNYTKERSKDGSYCYVISLYTNFQ